VGAVGHVPDWLVLILDTGTVEGSLFFCVLLVSLVVQVLLGGVMVIAYSASVCIKFGDFSGCWVLLEYNEW